MIKKWKILDFYIKCDTIILKRINKSTYLDKLCKEMYNICNSLNEGFKVYYY